MELGLSHTQNETLCVIQISGAPPPSRGGRGRSQVKCPHPRKDHYKISPGVPSDSPRGIQAGDYHFSPSKDQISKGVSDSPRGILGGDYHFLP